MKKLIWAVVFSIFLSTVAMVNAQGVNDTPTPEVTATDSPVVTQPEPYDRSQVLFDIVSIVGSLSLGFFAGRYSQGVSAAARELEKNKQFMDASERIALNTIPVTALDTIRGILADAKVGVDLLTKITDGLPNVVPNDSTPNKEVK